MEATLRNGSAEIGVVPLQQCQPAAIHVAVFRQLSPIHHACQKSHVGIGNLAGQRVLGSDLGDDLLAKSAEFSDQLVAEPQDFDSLVSAQHLERLHVRRVGLCQGFGQLGARRGLYQRTNRGREPIP